jgi:DNA polymerase-3 subunit alpha (Gram-positive type)
MTLEQLLDEYFASYDIKLLSIKLLKETQKLLIYLESEKIVADKEIDSFESGVKNTLETISDVMTIFNYSPSYLEPELFMKEIWPNTLELVGRKSIHTKTMLGKAKISFDKKIIRFTFPDEFTHNKLIKNNTDKFLGDYYTRMFNQPIQIGFDVDENHVDEDLIEHERLIMDETVKRAMEISKNYTPGDDSKSRPSKNEGGGGYSGGYSGGGSGGGSGGKYEKIPKILPENVVYRKSIRGETIPVAEANEEESIVIIGGEVFMIEDRILRGGKTLITFAISDGQDSMGVKMFLKPKDAATVQEKLKDGKRYLVEGVVRNDTYEKELVIFANAINTLPDLPRRMDKSEEKRVELHCHTSMSDMDGITSVKKLVKRAIEWGHPAIAVTDHGIVQAFPDAMHASDDGKDIKILYGVEGYLVDDIKPLMEKTNDFDWDQEFVVFDLETTGFSSKHDMCH